MKEIDLQVKDLKLLPQTRTFVDSYVPKASKWFLICVCFLLISFFVWAVYAPMDDVVIASAILRPADNISSLNVAVSGKIVSKHYTQNQRVNKGELLFQLDSSAQNYELETTKSQISEYNEELNEYMTFLSFIEKNNMEDPALLSTGSSFYIENYISEYKQLQFQVDSARNRYISESSKPDSLRIKSTVNEALNELNIRESNLSAWQSQQIIQLKKNIQSCTEKIKSLELRTVALESEINKMSVYAPIDGYISETVQLNDGDYIFSGTEILRIIPDELSRLKAEIVVDAAKVARIRKGQIVRLRFPGLPPSKFGQIQAEITLIPSDLTLSSNNPVFILEAEINNPFLTSNDGRVINLRSGLSAEARITVDTDSALRMILRKLDFVV